jgi:hypothetical protein
MSFPRHHRERGIGPPIRKRRAAEPDHGRDAFSMRRTEQAIDEGKAPLFDEITQHFHRELGGIATQVIDYQE